MRNFLFFLFVVCLSATSIGLLRTAKADSPIHLRYANFPAAATFPCVQMDKWTEEIHRRTNGKVKIETFPGGTLLDARSMLRGIARGQADIGCISLVYHPGSFPLFDLFGLPLGFKSATDASLALWESFKKFTPKELARYKVLVMFSSSPSQIMSSVPVNSLDDLSGLSLRASGALSDVLEALGGRSVSIPMSETPEALQKGVVKGVFSSWDTLKDLNYAERCRFGLRVDMPVYPFAVIMNMDAWKRLPADVQDAMNKYADEHARWTGAYVDEWGQAALDWAANTHDFALAKVTETDKAVMQQRTAPLLEAWKQNAAKQGINAQAVLTHVQQLRETLTSAH